MNKEIDKLIEVWKRKRVNYCAHTQFDSMILCNTAIKDLEALKSVTNISYNCDKSEQEQKHKEGLVVIDLSNHEASLAIFYELEAYMLENGVIKERNHDKEDVIKAFTLGQNLAVKQVIKAIDTNVSIPMEGFENQFAKQYYKQTFES